jgi:hypothetical protein
MSDPQNEKENRLIETMDQEGNIWKLVMYPIKNKTNRYQLSFCFNEKEFLLTKLQSNRYAEDLWDLINKIRKGNTSVKPCNFDVFRQSTKNIDEEIPCEQQAIN